ncbi:nuclear transport factor 2 family protein [Nocardia sp. NPDC050175]|uniref:nuclear transport factor 2 family protein n=1 Tax=Nocardia sp. NPDC050175 TaxID=3364317 RepID=UPI0037AAD564
MTTETFAEMVRFYYSNIDTGNVSTALSVFDSDCVYYRPGYEAMRGIEEVEFFYSKGRVITEGSHRVTKLVSSGVECFVAGVFAGQIRDRGSIVVDFSDYFRFHTSGKVIERRTYFFVPSV